jgi:hypothetical protein
MGTSVHYSHQFEKKHMNVYRSTFIATVASAAVVAAGATSAAAAPASGVEPVSYRLTLAGGSVVTTLEHGAFDDSDADGGVVVRDAAGRSLDTVPLTAVLDGRRLPLEARLSADRRTLTLTPSPADVDRHGPSPVASPLENQLAMNDLVNAVSVGTSLGSLIGTAVGLVVGAGIGLVVAGATCAVISLACVVAILPTVALTAGLGSIAGLVLGGGPVAAGAVTEYFRTLNAPPGTSKYAEPSHGRPGGPPVVRKAR